MRVVCSYCHADMGTKPGGSDDDVSHGCCPACAEEQNRKIDEYQQRRERERETERAHKLAQKATSK